MAGSKNAPTNRGVSLKGHRCVAIVYGPDRFKARKVIDIQACQEHRGKHEGRA